MKKPWIILIILAIVILSAIAVYRNFMHTPDEFRTDIRGTITNIVVNNAEEGIIFVEGQIEYDTSYDRASIRINKDTTITKGNTNTKINITQLKIGDRVEVKFKGEVALSYPVQATSDYISVLE